MDSSSDEDSDFYPIRFKRKEYQELISKGYKKKKWYSNDYNVIHKLFNREVGMHVMILHKIVFIKFYIILLNLLINLVL